MGVYTLIRRFGKTIVEDEVHYLGESYNSVAKQIEEAGIVPMGWFKIANNLWQNPVNRFQFFLVKEVR